MSTQINSPVEPSPAPSMYADSLFTGQQFLSRSTGVLADTGNTTFVTQESGAAVMNGVYIAFLKDSSDVYAKFTISSGTTITLLEDYGSDFSTTFGTDAKVNIDINSTALRVENQLGFAATIELVKLL